MKSKTRFTIFVLVILIVVTFTLSYKDDVNESFIGKMVKPYTRPLHRKMQRIYPGLYKRIGSFLPF